MGIRPVPDGHHAFTPLILRVFCGDSYVACGNDQGDEWGGFMVCAKICVGLENGTSAPLFKRLYPGTLTHARSLSSGGR
jgi:hypothetical protein